MVKEIFVKMYFARFVFFNVQLKTFFQSYNFVWNVMNRKKSSDFFLCESLKYKILNQLVVNGQIYLNN